MTCPIQSDIDFEAYLSEPTAPEWAGFREHYPTCPECSHELAEWSDLEALLRVASAPAESVHPSEEALLMFQNQPTDLAPEEHHSIGEHLSACVICRDALEAVASLDPERLDVKRPLDKAAPGLLSRLAEFLRPVIQLPPARVPALAILLLLVLIPVGLFVWSTWMGPAEGPSGAPDAQLAAVEPAPEPVAPGPEEPRVPGAGAAPVEAPEEPALVAAEEAKEPPGAAEVREPSAVAEEPAVRTEVAAEEPAARTEVAAVKPPPQPVPKPAPAQEPIEPIPTEPMEQAAEEAPESADPLVLAALAEARPPLYVPPSRGMPSVRIGGGTRTALAELPALLAAAPSHVGLTVEESPTLYWFLSEDSTVPAQFALSEPDSIDPILEFTLSPPVKAGMHAVRLSERGVVLQPGTQYRWFVALVPDEARRSKDVIAGGVIDRIQPDAQLRAQLEEADPSQLGHIYARNGLWYDALGFLSGWIERYPEEPRLRTQRAALLEQVGLEEAAVWERRAAQTPR